MVKYKGPRNYIVATTVYTSNSGSSGLCEHYVYMVHRYTCIRILIHIKINNKQELEPSLSNTANPCLLKPGARAGCGGGAHL